MWGKLKTKPLEYQIEDVERIQEFEGRALLAHSMGLGKSLVTLLWMHKYLEEGPVVIVCPASIKWNWEAECRKHLGIRPHVLDTMKSRELDLSPERVWIINYDIIGPTRRGEGWLKALRKIKPKLVVGDESHYLGGLRTARTKHFRKLCKRVPHVLLLSGTPLTARPAQLWPSLNILHPDEWGSFFSYAQDHCAPRRTHWGWEYKGAANLKRLHRKLLNTCLIRRRKEDVLKDLPAKQRHVVVMSLENEKEVSQAHRNFAQWLVKSSKRKARTTLQTERITRWSYLRQIVAKAKYKAMKQWVLDFMEDSEEKLILFGVHRSIVRGMHKEFKDESVLVDGAVTKKDRVKAFSTFVGGSETKILFGNVEAAGVGWSAPGVSHAAFLELPYNPGQVEQAADRIHGIGRGQKGVRSNIWFLIGKGTIEEDLAKMLTKKQATLSKTLDGKSNSGDLDLMSLMETSLMEKYA